jgi:hypothetical protein
LIARMDAVNAPVLGVILNGVDMQNPEFAYYGHYRSYYPENEQSPVENKNGNSPTQTVQQPHSNGTSTQLLNVTEQQPQAAKPTATQSGRENGEDRIKQQSNGDGNSKNQDEVRPAADIVPQESLNQLIVSLGKSLGTATSSLVVREQIANLGESFFAFPKKRMGELLKLIQRKITQRSVTFL